MTQLQTTENTREFQLNHLPTTALNFAIDSIDIYRFCAITRPTEYFSTMRNLLWLFDILCWECTQLRRRVFHTAQML